MARRTLFFGSLLMLLAVIAGAVGSHALAAHLDERQLNSFTLAYQFQIYHALGMIGLYAIQKKIGVHWVFYFFLTGVLLFCGSIYMITYGHLTDNESLVTLFRKITPIGGVSFMIGWLLLLIKSMRITI
jgi:uncharacterized membrane protein YgdD (TMEM256/DUF423 family)